VCIALTGSSWQELAGAMVATAAACIVPAVVDTPVHFAGLRGPLVTIVLATGIGIATRLLVAAVRIQAETAERDRRAVQRVGEVVYGLFASKDVRADLCAASLQVGYADVAMLLEPTSDGDLRVSAQAGVQENVVGRTLAAGDPLAALLREGRRHLHDDIVGPRLASSQAVGLWERAGRPEAILYQPLLRGSEPVGLLCIGWHDEVRLSGPRVTAIELLTHEAALLLTRADQVTRLTGMATTDPLTGLPNRRAWDAKIAQAEVQPRVVTVAMIDLDNFKAFNDTHGHLAGDALLRQTADAWTAQLRNGDLLARVGGEEFGLLVYDEVQAAHRVAERMRQAVTHEQTCCIGLAQRRPGEPMEAVVRRADRALYEAKAAGRDLARAAQ